MAQAEEIAHAIAGAGGGALSMIVTYPLVTLSTLAQTTQKKKEQQQQAQPESIEPKVPIKITNLHLKAADAIVKSSSYQAAKEIINQKGPLGLYSGLESALYGITLTNFIYYYFYEITSNVFLKANVAASRRGHGLSTFQSIITGAIAGALTCVGSNPFWVANTRMMTAAKQQQKQQDTDEVSSKLPPKTKSGSTFKTLIDIIENDGVGTLFAGVLPALVLVINPIIQYTIFEQVKNIIVASNGINSFTAIKAFFIGAFGKLIATSLTYPYITLKSRMHVKKQKISSKKGDDVDVKDIKLSMFQEIKKIIHEEGLEGLYRGLTVKLVQSITTAAFLFYFKEELLTGSVKLVEIFRLLSLRKNKNIA